MTTAAFTHNNFGEIPATYDPGLSEDVVACAERIADYFLERQDQFGKSARTNTVELFRLVRMSMNRNTYNMGQTPTLDDESITHGIVRAMNKADGFPIDTKRT